jgi:hypothetical protein
LNSLVNLPPSYAESAAKYMVWEGKASLGSGTLNNFHYAEKQFILDFEELSPFGGKSKSRDVHIQRKWTEAEKTTRTEPWSTEE